MRKKLLCILLTLCMVLTLMPVTVLAGNWENVTIIGFNYGANGFLDITMPTTTGYYSYGTATGNSATQIASDVATLPENGWNWAVERHAPDSNGIEYTLMLSDFNITYSGTNDCLMFKCNLNLKLDGTNIISGESAGTGLSANIGCDLYISGDGNLTVTAKSMGINIPDSNLYISGGVIISRGGHYGIHCTGQIVISGATVTASGSSYKAINNTFNYNSLKAIASEDVSGSSSNDFDPVMIHFYKYIKVWPSSEKAITAFTLAGVTGIINETDHTIRVTVPYGTDVSNLVASFTLSENASAEVGSTTQNSGTTINNFTNLVTYTVVAQDNSTQTYTVTVTVGNPKLTSVTAPSPLTLTNTYNSANEVISGTELPSTVTITAEDSATTLPCVWTFTSGTYNAAAGATNTFHWTATTTGYEVNGKTVSGDVTITNKPSSEKAITAFTLAGSNGIINETDHTIRVTVPYGTDVSNLVASFTLSENASAEVGSTTQNSGTTINNFTNLVTYTVVAQDNSTQTYTVTVTVGNPKLTSVTAPSPLTLTNTYNSANEVISGTELPSTVTITAEDSATTLPCVWTFTSGTYNAAVGATNTFHWTATTTGYDVNGKTVSGDVTITNKQPSSKKAITAFTLAGVTGTINETDHTIGVTVPYGTDVSSLVASFTLSENASAEVDSIIQISGTTSNNFTNPVTYTVVAQDNSTQTYTVTVTTASAPTPPSLGGYTPPAPVTEIKSGGSVTGSNLDQLVSGGKTLTVNGDKGAKLVFDTEALKGVDGQTSGEIKVEMKDVSSAHQESLPGKQVFALTVSSGSGTISNFGGKVTVSLPYELKAGENAQDVTVWYLASDGTMTEISCTYDPATKLATFTATHFSLYVVGVAETEPWVNPFTDVSKSDWFFGAVEFANRNGLFAGTGVDTFSPNSLMTRAMLWTVLGRLDGQSLSGSGVFDAARIWAMGAGITDGTNPDGNITREQMVTILWRYAGSPKAGGELSKFSDAGSVTSYAAEAMAWAVEKGILAGANGALMPKDNATRAQVAAILQRFITKTAK